METTKTILTIVALNIVIYLMGIFITLDFRVTHWNADTRFIIALITIVVTVLTTIIFRINDDN